MSHPPADRSAPDFSTSERLTRLEFAARSEELPRVAAWLTSQARLDRVPERLEFALDLFVQEALANAISHGNASSDPTPASITYRHGGTTLVVELVYGGIAFDPTTAPLPPAPTSLATAPLGGFGLRLMRDFPGQVGYAREGERNRLRLSCAL